MIPEVPAFAGDIKDASALQIIIGAQYRTINRGGDSIMEKIRAAGYNPFVTGSTISDQWH